MAQEFRYGELQDWSDADVSTGSGFMKLTEGDNLVRIITKPFQFTVAWIKDSAGKSSKVRSALVKGCPLIKRGDKLQNRWYLGVIERRSGATKILEVSGQILGQVQEYAQDKENYGDPRGYDINIKRRPPNSQPLYMVRAMPPKPLNEADKALAEQFAKNTDLAKMTKPPTVEEVAERLATIVGAQAVSGSQASHGGGGKVDIDPDLFNYDTEQL